MPRARAIAWLAAAALAPAFAAYGADTPRPDLGAGPHLDRSESLGGECKARRGSEPPAPVKPATSPNSSSGSSAETPDDAHSQQLREEDEKKATRNKEKMKKRPGFKEDVPAPRAHAQ